MKQGIFKFFFLHIKPFLNKSTHTCFSSMPSTWTIHLFKCLLIKFRVRLPTVNRIKSLLPCYIMNSVHISLCVCVCMHVLVHLWRPILVLDLGSEDIFAKWRHFVGGLFTKSLRVISLKVQMCVCVCMRVWERVSVKTELDIRTMP